MSDVTIPTPTPEVIPPVTPPATPPADPDTITYTQAELTALLQSEGDKRVSNARKKFEAEFTTKVELERKEAEALAKLSEEEKTQVLLDKQRREIESREQVLAKKELTIETVKILSEKELPVSMIDMLVTDNAEQTKKNIDSFESAFRKEVEKAVNDRLKGKVPSKGNNDFTGMTTEQFVNLNYAGRINLLNSNPDLYNMLQAQAQAK